MMKRLIAIVLSAALLASLWGCSVPEEDRFINPTESIPCSSEAPTTQDPPATTVASTHPTVPPSKPTAGDLADEMSPDEQVAQLFLVKCPVGGAAQLLNDYHVGGIVLFDQDIDGETPETLRAELADYQSRVPFPLIVAVDEEGGVVNRISNHTAFRSEPFGPIHDIYYNGGLSALRETETEKSQLLKGLGINVNLAPVCDVVCQGDAFMASRSLRQTAKITGEAVAAMVKTMQKNGVGAVLKHFPGFGNLTGDTHTGKVVDDRPLEDLKTYDYVPFQKGIQAKVGAVMVSHSIVNAIDPTHPATLSSDVHAVLRNELKFTGVIMTDDLAMGAITEIYDPGEAAVQAFLAGNDLLLTAWSEERYNAVLAAVNNGRIPPERLRESVVRIIQWKMDLGLL